MIQVVALILLAALIGYAEVKKNLAKKWVQSIKWGLVLSSPLWLGGLSAVFAVFLFFQASYIPAKNYFSGKDVWFIDNETWLGELIVDYLGENAGKYLYIGEVLLGIVILIAL